MFVFFAACFLLFQRKCKFESTRHNWGNEAIVCFSYLIGKLGSLCVIEEQQDKQTKERVGILPASACCVNNGAWLTSHNYLWNAVLTASLTLVILHEFIIYGRTPSILWRLIYY